MELSSHTDLMSQIVDRLKQHAESFRIKKLLFCICHNRWENNKHILEGTRLDQLIEATIKVHPNIESLSIAIYRIIKAINRPKTYSTIASLVIGELGKVYLADAKQAILLTETKEASDPLITNNFLVERTIIEFESHPESTRIKKLIFAACKKQWQNDIQVIERYGLKQLLLELLKNYKDFDALSRQFKRIITRINKKDVYSPVIKLILAGFEAFYLGDPDESNGLDSNRIDTQAIRSIWSKDAAINHQASRLEPHEAPFKSIQSARRRNFATVMHQGPAGDSLPAPLNSSLSANESSSLSKDSVRSSRPDFATVVNANFGNDPNPAQDDPVVTKQTNQHFLEKLVSVLEDSSEGLDAEAASPVQQPQISPSGALPSAMKNSNQPDALLALESVPESCDWFELRLELIKYGNPLRVKILLFSALFHPFRHNSPDWVLMKDHTLDELVAQLLEKYPQNYLKKALQNAAAALDEPQTYRLSAKSIIQTLEAFC